MTATAPYNNHSLVGEALRLLASGLGPYVVDKMNNAVQSGRYVPDDAEAVNEISGDVAVTLRVMVAAWNDVFRDLLGPVERSLVSEIRETRNRWAHQDAFDDDDLDRALDSMGRLLNAVGAAEEAKRIDNAKHRLRVKRYGAPLPKAADQNGSTTNGSTTNGSDAEAETPDDAADVPVAERPSEPPTNFETAEEASEKQRAAVAAARDDKVREHIVHGIDYRRREHYGNAMAEFEQALSIDSQRADAWFHRGMTWGLMGEHRRAIDDFGRSLAISPGSAHAYNGRGYAHYCMGEYRQAVEDLERASRLMPDDELILGNLQQARMRYLQQPESPNGARHGSEPIV